MASGLALGKDAAVADDISVVANTQGFANIVVGDQNTDASFPSGNARCAEFQSPQSGRHRQTVRRAK